MNNLKVLDESAVQQWLKMNQTNVPGLIQSMMTTADVKPIDWPAQSAKQMLSKAMQSAAIPSFEWVGIKRTPEPPESIKKYLPLNQQKATEVEITVAVSILEVLSDTNSSLGFLIAAQEKNKTQSDSALWGVGPDKKLVYHRSLERLFPEAINLLMQISQMGEAGLRALSESSVLERQIKHAPPTPISRL